ncbi:N-Dimethylarginine dimethylaminohydrolase [Sanguibacter gelidistatuariae]|uniref:N-Dimethylarginine dimethylaminohydrolase n=1 Tax=Sanguibacter gelidistatuariae TaxID=1814289 RepID=A0A1G6Q250_9MICO|nr:dimethylargininase [Sanguibacter gelidistatuariae]SDC86520.1 N-Dimethylarginine dimethylaminohydrolase [Sanguibacter gelidistatuariae]
MTQAHRYLMCRPDHFTVSYEINPWMNSRVPTDTALAVKQWEWLRDVYLDLGHTVELIDPVPGLPDMVYAANGATVVDGVVYGARFTVAQRASEAAVYLDWFARRGFAVHDAVHRNEGEGDLLTVGERILAGTGFRTEVAAHREAAALWGREVVTLELVDPRFYHLDTAVIVLEGSDGDPGDRGRGRPGPGQIAYYPGAFSPASVDLLAALFPDAVLATEADATVLGLNGVSDGTHVVLSPRATRLAGQLTERGYTPIAVDTSELLLGGGGAKCCTLEIRPAR